jgi:hypothetical protein
MKMLDVVSKIRPRFMAVLRVFWACLLLTLPAPLALARTQVNTFKLRNVDQILKRAKAQGFGISASERAAKEDIIRLQRKDPEKYLYLMDSFDPFVKEINAGLPQVEKGKILVRHYFLEALEKSHKELNQTAFNGANSEKWKINRQAAINDLLKKLEFVPVPGGNYYRYQLDWGFAEITKDFKTVRTHITAAEHLDYNQLTEEAKNIQMPEGAE